jgi:hypothetical protein
LRSVVVVMNGSKVSGLVWFAWAVAACSSQVPVGDVRSDATTNMAGRSGAAGRAGTASDGGGSGGAGSSGAADGSVGDAAIGDASGGAGGSNTGDGATDASSNGDSGGAGGTSTSDGASGDGGSEGGLPEGGPAASTACDLVLKLADRESWIAFDSDRDNYNRNLYMMHPDGAGLTQLTKGANVDREPYFSYDGTLLSYTSSVAGKPQLFLMKMETLTSVQLTNRPEGAEQSAFSRDGKWVAFHSGVSVYVIKTDGTGEKLVATSSYVPGSGGYRWPAFSADGSELVVDQGTSIEALKIDSPGSRHIVTNTNQAMEMPAVSPSGADVAASLNCGTPTTTWIWSSPLAAPTPPCMGQARRVTPTDNFDSRRATWGSDVVLAYHRVNRATNVAVIAMITRTDDRPCLLTTGPDDSRNPSWSQKALNLPEVRP